MSQDKVNATLTSPDLFDRIEKMPRGDQASWLFLDPSEEFQGYWSIESIWPEWFFDFEPLVGSFRLVSPASLPAFLDYASDLGYHVAFTQEPTNLLNAYDYLDDLPGVQLNSSIPGNENGFLSWQKQGYNKLIRNEEITAGYIVWLTGGGKMFFIASAIKHHMEIGHPFDLAFVVVKSHNKIDSQRKLKALGDIDATIIDGTKEKRERMYAAVHNQVKSGNQQVVIVNYEKFREDADWLQILATKRNVLLFWDEMPTKLSNRETQLYRSVQRVLYKSFPSKPRVAWMRHFNMTATPIENSPDDVYSCVNLMNPGLLGTPREFYNRYAAAINPNSKKPSAWMNLDRLEARLQFMTHRVSKDTPGVREMFPEVMQMETKIDWNPKHRSVYDKLTGKAKDLMEELEDANILALIQIMQMVCDAPSMVIASAANREKFLEMVAQANDELQIPPAGSDIALTLLASLGSAQFADAGHTKLETWREIICEKHPDEKIVTHSTWADYIFPVWEECLNSWGVSYVIYRGTGKQKQYALDAFREDPSIRCFLSGDAGSDSIDIDIAPVGVNYNIPWKWTTLKQREGRRDRVSSAFDFIYTYALVMPDSVDERKLEICDRKRSFHEQIFDGKAVDEAISASMTREDLRYILFGSNES